MSLLQISDGEARGIDAQLEGMLDWATTRRDEAEQLAMDATRLLSCTNDRLDKLSKQGFFKRCWKKFNGDTAAVQHANMQDIVQMQKISMRYLNMLQERELLLAHSMLTLKNNLLSLAVKEEETRKLITMLAERTQMRFEKLEHRVDQLEISTNLLGWLLSLEEMDYEEKFPTEYMRLFKIINDFYSIKNDNWNYRDLMFMRKAMRTVRIDPKKKISLGTFIENLIDEIQHVNINFFENMITAFKPDSEDNYHTFAIDNISSPVFTAMHTLIAKYEDRYDLVEEIREKLHKDFSADDVLKGVLKSTIKKQNVSLDYEFPLAETAIEILGCLRLTGKLSLEQYGQQEAHTVAQIPSKTVEEISSQADKIDVNNLNLGRWKCSSHDVLQVKALDFTYDGTKFWRVLLHPQTIDVYNSCNLQDWKKINSIDGEFDKSEFSYVFIGNADLIFSPP